MLLPSTSYTYRHSPRYESSMSLNNRWRYETCVYIKRIARYLDFFLHNSNFNAFTLTLVIGEEWNFKCFFPANFLTTASSGQHGERYNLFTCQNKGLEKTAAKSSS